MKGATLQVDLILVVLSFFPEDQRKGPKPRNMTVDPKTPGLILGYRALKTVRS